MELNPTTDLIRNLEGELVRITTSDGYEMMDYFSLPDKESIYLTSNRCSVKLKNLTSIQWIKDYKGCSKDAFYVMIESTQEH